MPFKTLFFVSAAASMLGACATVDQQTGSPDPGFGEASRWNAAVQIIDPAPVYTEADAKPGDSGAKAAEATERYRTDRVKEPRPQTTSSTGQGSGPGAGSGGSQGQGPQ